MSEVETPIAPQRTGDRSLHTLAWVPLRISLEAPVEDFSVRDLLSLRPGVVVRTTIPLAGTIPLLVNGKLLARGKLEVIANRLAARIAELT